MGLAAFNKMRREEAMRPENITKTKEIIEESKKEIMEETKEEETTVRRPRRRT